MINWQKYFTPHTVADKIIKLIPNNYQPNLLVDICFGSGNFLKAGLRRWDVECIGIDEKILDEDPGNIKISKFKLNALNQKNISFLKDYSNKIILANPPFGRLDDDDIVENNCFSELSLLAIKSKRIEACMLVSNLSILNNGEILSAIIPENIFTSIKLESFRNLFFSYFDILYIGEAERYFNQCEVRTRIFIGIYNQSKRNLCNKLEGKDKRIPGIKFSVYRGVDNSLILKNKSLINKSCFEKILHFSSKPSEGYNFGYINSNLIKKRKIVHKGDILVSRVGRYCGRVYLIKREYDGYLFSDYFYAITNHNLKVSSKLLLFLESNLKNRIKGLTTNYISKNDILEVLNSLYKI